MVPAEVIDVIPCGTGALGETQMIAGPDHLLTGALPPQLHAEALLGEVQCPGAVAVQED